MIMMLAGRVMMITILSIASLQAPSWRTTQTSRICTLQWPTQGEKSLSSTNTDFTGIKHCHCWHWHHHHHCNDLQGEKSGVEPMPGCRSCRSRTSCCRYGSSHIFFFLSFSLIWYGSYHLCFFDFSFVCLLLMWFLSLSFISNDVVSNLGRPTTQIWMI